MMHGSPSSGFSEVKPYIGDYGHGVYLTHSKDVAKHYSRGRGKVAAYILGDTPIAPKAGTVYFVKHGMKNPLVIRTGRQAEKLFDEVGRKFPEIEMEERGLAKLAKSMGHDGIVNLVDKETIVFTRKAIPVLRSFTHGGKPRSLGAAAARDYGTARYNRLNKVEEPVIRAAEDVVNVDEIGVGIVSQGAVVPSTTPSGLEAAGFLTNGGKFMTSDMSHSGMLASGGFRKGEMVAGDLSYINKYLRESGNVRVWAQPHDLNIVVSHPPTRAQAESIARLARNRKVYWEIMESDSLTLPSNSSSSFRVGDFFRAVQDVYGQAVR